MDKIYTQLIKKSIVRKISTSEEFLKFKKTFLSEHRMSQPTNADLREFYETLVKKRSIKRSPAFEKALLSRRIRTQSGVAVVAVLTKSYPCPGKCLYCPTEKNMPKSYLSNEPAVMRAIAAKFDPYVQVQNRLRSLELNGHKTDKIELIVMGGTFSYLPKPYQLKFITECFRACNEYGKNNRVFKAHKIIHSPAEKLSREQDKNEKTKHRIIGLTLETRPDYVDEKEILNFRKLGCTRVELGVQSIFDQVLKLNKRGHSVKATIRATKLLKDAGFKINYHMMPGLPGSNLKKDFEMFQKLFSNSDFQPDMLKIYPTVVVKNSALYNFWKKCLPRSDFRRKSTSGGNYKPLTNKQFEKLVLKIKNEVIPPYVRISRLVRDVPESAIIAGPTVSNLRQIIIPRSKCQCIRCREVGADYKITDRIILDRINYDASGGKEIFLQYVSPASNSNQGEPDKKKLFALLRLRIPSQGSTFLNLKVEPFALIREVHTYGKLAEINKKDKAGPQHIGLGKKLMQEAEKIAREEYNLKKIVVISGVGVRDYYRKLGYRLENTYMVKSL